MDFVQEFVWLHRAGLNVRQCDSLRRKLHASQHVIGSFICSPFLRLMSGIEQIGQLPGALRTMLGCMAQ